MPTPTSGRIHMAQAIGGEAVTAFNAANAYLGVGDSSTAFTLAQTDLQAATNKIRKGMDSTFPTRSANVLTYKSTYISTEANFVWSEMGLFNGATGATMLIREVSALGTKSGGTWSLTHTLTFAV